MVAEYRARREMLVPAAQRHPRLPLPAAARRVLRLSRGLGLLPPGAGRLGGPRHLPAGRSRRGRGARGRLRRRGAHPPLLRVLAGHPRRRAGTDRHGRLAANPEPFCGGLYEDVSSMHSVSPPRSWQGPGSSWRWRRALPSWPRPRWRKALHPPSKKPASSSKTARRSCFDLAIEAQRAAWVQANFITFDTEILAAQRNEVLLGASIEAAQEASRFDSVQLPEDLRRQMDLLKRAIDAAGAERAREDRRDGPTERPPRAPCTARAGTARAGRRRVQAAAGSRRHHDDEP